MSIYTDDLWDPQYDNLDPEDFLFDIVQEFRRNNPPPENYTGDPDLYYNPEYNPGAAGALDYYLYYGVPDLTIEEKKDRLEQTYYSRLMDIGREYAAKRAEDMIERDKDGLLPPDDVLRDIHDDTLSQAMEEEARKAAEDNYIHTMRLGTLEAYHEHKEAQEEHDEPIATVYGPVDKWVLSPGVTKALSEKKGYNGNFYSWFFAQEENTRELDEKFFKTVRDGLENGDTEREIIDKATEVCTGDSLNRQRIKNIVRTETTRAFNLGLIYENERIAAELGERGIPGGVMAYRYNAVIDGREWEGCKFRHGLLIGATDPLLEENTPPLHYFCRSSISPITEYEFYEEYDGEATLKRDREKLLQAPKFVWHYTPDKGIFEEAELPD